jgi:prepilin-type N-terminal cleavage/methylation domain-containing protein
VSPPPTDRGFSLPELLVALVLIAIVAAAALSALSRQVSIASAQPDIADLTQRIRTAADLIAQAVASAGAWSELEAADAQLACCLPAVQPRRVGLRGADASGTARDDRLTVLTVRQARPAGRLAAPLAGPGALLLSGCPAPSALCELAVGDHLMVFLSNGTHDFFRVESAAGTAATVSLRQSGPAAVYGTGARAAGIETVTFWFDRENRQLRRYDGHLSDVPVVDDLVAMRGEFWGASGVATAGHLSGVDTCTYDAAGQPWPGLTETGAGAGLELIPLSAFRDGPWCGEGDNRFDADILRIRRVSLFLRFRATPAQARGSGHLWMDPGTGTNVHGLTGDREVRIDAAPRASAHGH